MSREVVFVGIDGESTEGETREPDYRQLEKRFLSKLEKYEQAKDRREWGRQLYHIIIGELGGIRLHPRIRADWIDVTPIWLRRHNGLAPDQITRELRRDYPYLGVKDQHDLYGLLYDYQKTYRVRADRPDLPRELEYDYTPPAAPDNYWLLQDSDGYTVEAKPRLSTIQCLDFLLTIRYRYDRKRYQLFPIWYGSGYDVNHIVRDLPHEDLTELWQDGITEYWPEGVEGGYRIIWFPRKKLIVSRIDGEAQTQETVTTYDVLGFCQTKFVTALEEYGLLEGEQREFIAAMKAQRGSFSQVTDEQVKKYNALEVEKLAELGRAIWDLHQEAGIPLQSMHGAGASAAALLRLNRVPDHIRHPPLSMEEAVRCAYFGGRVQCLWQGHFDRVWRYDINSAYPAAAVMLPSLKGSQWTLVDIDDRHNGGTYYRWDLYDVSWDWPVNDHHVFPLPVRSEWGRIVYPHRGRGWYWGIELQGLTGLHVHRKIRVDTNPDCGHPFSFIPDLYDLRKVYKQAGDLRQIALKLALNASYGKLAQSAGRKFGSREAPPYHSLVYAGMITAATRYMLRRLVEGFERYVIAFATDGITMARPIPAVELNDRLGGWDLEVWDNAFWVQPGVYWGTGEDGEIHYYSRGVLASEFTDNLQDIVSAWEADRWSLHFQSSRFKGLGMSLRSEDVAADWLAWPERERALNLQSDWFLHCPWPTMQPTNEEPQLQRARPMFCPVIPDQPSQMYIPKAEWLIDEDRRARENYLDQPELNDGPP